MSQEQLNKAFGSILTAGDMSQQSLFVTKKEPTAALDHFQDFDYVDISLDERTSGVAWDRRPFKQEMPLSLKRHPLESSSSGRFKVISWEDQAIQK